MASFEIIGGNRLNGEITPQGAKNEALQLLMYVSAIFYDINTFPAKVQNLFLLNPVYLFIRYFRKIVIDLAIPDWRFHLLMLFETAVVVGIGAHMYKKYNNEFIYYI